MPPLKEGNNVFASVCLLLFLSHRLLKLFMNFLRSFGTLKVRASSLVQMSDLLCIFPVFFYRSDAF